MATGIVVGIKGQIALESKGTEVVDAANVVVVFVGDENGIQRFVHADAEHLFAEVRTAIQQKPCVALLEECRSTQATVARVAAGANFATASYLWYADACACSEESYLHFTILQFHDFTIKLSVCPFVQLSNHIDFWL